MSLQHPTLPTYLGASKAGCLSVSRLEWRQAGGTRPIGLSQNTQDILLFRKDLFGLRKTVHCLISNGGRVILKVDNGANYNSSH